MRRFELVAIVMIVILGAVLRLYRLPESLMFRGDQGRDAIIAKNILKHGDIALIGPVTSVGNMYLGPLYYYFMVPFLAVTYPDPVGAAYGVALVNILTIYLVYWVGKKTFGSPTGLMAALIFALMPLAVIYGRFSWNPNIAPFFSILIFYALYRWWQTKSYSTLFVAGVLIGLLSQTHYVSLTVAVTAGLLWLSGLARDRRINHAFKEILVGASGFLVTTLPLIAFDFRHNHLITKQFISFFLSPEKHLNSKGIFEQVVQIYVKAEYILASILHMPKDMPIDGVILTVAILLLGICLAGLKPKINPAVGILLAWLLTAILGTSFYSHTTFAHYLTYCFPLVSLFWGYITTVFLTKKYLYAGIGVGLLLIGVQINGLKSVLWGGMGTRMLSTSVESALPLIVEPYNITLLSDDKDYKGMSYRYFFEVSPKQPLSPENYSGLNTLVVIDETFLDDPRSVPIYEIETARDFYLEKKIVIPEGPWVYIYKKG